MVSSTPETTEIAEATPSALSVMLGRVRAERTTADRAEAAILELAVAWAHTHPASPGDRSWRVTMASEFEREDEEFASPEEREGYGIPPVAWDAPASFAAANSMSTTAGKTLIRDALVLHHRLPEIYARVVAGQVPTWRARRIAQAVLGAPADVVAHIDATLAAIAHTVGPVTLHRLLDEAMLRLHAEDREIAQLEALDARHATLDERSVNTAGIADMHLRGDWKDLHDFDQALSRVAAALKTTPEGEHESLDVRRSIAVGILADPYRAVALLTGGDAPKPSKHTILYLHLTDYALAGLATVGRNGTLNIPMLEQQIRAWCGRDDTHLSVKPVIDLNTHTAVEAYEIPDRLAERVSLTHPTCVFPWCTRPSRSCDCDHRIPYAAGGPTCECNLTPLCRHHHLLKTHAGWRYTRVEPGVYLWTDPFDQRFLRNHDGTTNLTPD